MKSAVKKLLWGVLCLLLVGSVFFIHLFHKISPDLLLSRLSSFTYKKVVSAYSLFYPEHFMISSALYSGNYLYVGTLSGISVFDVRNEKNITLIKEVHLYGRTEYMAKENNVLYASSGASGLYILDISVPENPHPIGNVSLFSRYHVYHLAVKSNIVYLGTDKGLLVVNARNPQKPFLSLSLPAGTYQWIHIHDNELYCAESEKGLAIFDISSPEHPKLIAEINLYVPTFGKPLPADLPPLTVTTVGNYAYVTNGYEGLSIINIHDPSHPFLVKQIGKSKNMFWDQITVVGRYLTVKLSPARVVFLDISNPENPVIIKSTKGVGFPANGVQGSKAVFVTHPSGFKIVNIHDALSPEELGSYWLKPEAMDVKTHGNYVYVAYGGAGLKIYKVSDEGEISQTGSIVTSGIAGRLCISFPYAYVANGVSGVDVINVKDPANPILKNTINFEQHTWDAAVYKKLLYLAAASRGLTVYNMTNPINPILAPGFEKNTNLNNGYFFKVSLSPPSAFLVSFWGGVQRFKLKNPYTLTPFFGKISLTTFIRPLMAYDIISQGNIAYLGYKGGIKVLRTNNGSQASVIEDYPTGGQVVGFDIQNNLLFAADYKNGIYIFDIENPAKLNLLTRIAVKGHARAIKVKENYCYVAAGKAGLAAIKLSTQKIDYFK